jgi:hypothetical protein
MLPARLRGISEIGALKIWLRVHMPSDRRVVAVVKFETIDFCPLCGVRRDIGFNVVKAFGLAVWPLPNYRVSEM